MQMNGIHHKLASHAKLHILSTKKTPPKSPYLWGAKSVCEQHERTRHAIWHLKHTDKQNCNAATPDRSDRSKRPVNTSQHSTQLRPVRHVLPTGQPGQRQPAQPKADSKSITSHKNFTLSQVFLMHLNHDKYTQ